MWIRATRRSQGIKISDLAKECGMDVSSFSYFERGRNFLKMSNFQNVLDVLGYEFQIVKKGESDGI